MARTVGHDAGGIRSLLVELKQHGEAINYDLITRVGITRSDLGRLLGWRDFRDFLTWMPPTEESAWFRARRPNSWWVTPQIQLLAGIMHVLEGANWQRGGGVGTQPTPIKFPEDRKRSPIDEEELARRREQLRQRREQR